MWLLVRIILFSMGLYALFSQMGVYFHNPYGY